MNEVAPGIFMITESENSLLVKFSVNVYIIADYEGLIFDAGFGKKKAINQLVLSVEKAISTMAQRGKVCKVNTILPSHGHWDHFSGIERLRRLTGIRPAATARMMKSMGSKKLYKKSFRQETKIGNTPSSPYLRLLYRIFNSLTDEAFIRLFGVCFVREPVEIIKENSILSTGSRRWEVIHLPGHCDDDIVLYDREEGILLGGDIILRRVTTWLGPPRSNLATYIESLEYILNLSGLKLILPAHGSPVTDPKPRLKEAIAHRHKRTEKLFEIISESGSRGIKFQQIFSSFYPKIKIMEKYIAIGWIETTLEHLIDTGRITTSGKGKNRYFRA